MLGVKDCKDNSVRENEKRPKRVKSKTLIHSIGNDSDKNKEHINTEPEEIPVTLPVQGFRDNKQMESEKIKDETTITIYSTPQQSEDSTRAFMGSIGTWINELFNVHHKRLQASRKLEDTKPFNPEPLVDVDSEYFKSVNALKAQLRKKLKSETSVHISTPDKMMEFNFSKVSDREKKVKKRSKSLPSSESIENLIDFFDNQQPFVTENDRVLRSNNRNVPKVGLKMNEKENTLQSIEKTNDSFSLNNSNLVKEKKKNRHKNRAEIGELEEYVFPTPAELSRRLLLNINEQERSTQLYKNTHFRLQDTQPYNVPGRKNQSYQSSTRCYTTDTNLIENSISFVNSKNSGSHFFPSESRDIKTGDDFALKRRPLDGRKQSFNNKLPRAAFSEFSRESSTFVKIRSPKSLIKAQIEPPRDEVKASSDDLVKYLMKKVKTNHRPQAGKKKTATLIPMPHANKAKFMQSATSSLVTNVIAKKENEFQIPPKTGTRIAENKLKPEYLVKASFPSKDWNARAMDTNVRFFDLKRSAGQSNFNRNTYLSDECGSQEVEDFLYDKPNTKYSRRPYEEVLKRDLKEKNQKYNKRQEVRNMLSKIDLKNNIFHMSKSKQNEQKKKAVKNIIDNLKVTDMREGQSGRFKEQHELFKNNIKTVQELTSSEINQEIMQIGTQKEADTKSLCTELAAVADKSLQLVPERPKGVTKCDVPEVRHIEESLTVDLAENSPTKCADSLSLEIKPADANGDKNKVADKQSNSKDKTHKTKSLQFLKEDPKGLIVPLTDFYSELPNTKESSKVHEPSAICNPELHHTKALDTAFLNRRYSTNSLSEVGKQKLKTQALNCPPPKTAFLGAEPFKDEPDKKAVKEKKKEKDFKESNIENPAPDIVAENEKNRKPGPNCEEGISSSSS